MLLPLLVGDQRRLVLLLLSLPQQPLLVRLDAPTCASFNRRIQDQFQLKKTKNGIEIAETPCQHFIQCLAVQ